MDNQTKLIYADRVILQHLLEDVKQAEQRLAQANKALADRLTLHMEVSATLDHPSLAAGWLAWVPNHHALSKPMIRHESEPRLGHHRSRPATEEEVRAELERREQAPLGDRLIAEFCNPTEPPPANIRKRILPGDKQ